MAKLIYGSEVSSEIKEEMKIKIEKYVQDGHRTPCLSVILVGDDPASHSYVKGKEKACASIGMKTITTLLDANTTQEELEDVIDRFNKDPEVDGILVQLPLPKGLNETSAILKIDPDKDVDGLHPINIGRMYSGLDGFVPCTPRGCVELLDRMGCNCDGKHAVVIGRSKLVGAPVAKLLQDRNATVTICHSHTKNMKELCKTADILIVAMGKAKYVNHEFVKEGAYVIDVGVNRGEDGKLCGDVDTADVMELAEYITPVPKGVGPMTICMLLANTLKSYERKELC